MSFEENKKKIIVLLTDHSQLISQSEKLNTIPNNYAEVQQAAIVMELENEVKKLFELFTNDTLSETDVKIQFQKLCATRAEEIKNSCLDWFVASENHCNQLYFTISTILFCPKNLYELLQIILPHIQYFLRVEFSDTLAPNIDQLKTSTLDRIQMQLKKEPLNQLPEYPAELSYFNQIIVGNNIILPLAEIHSYPLLIHYKLYQLLERYPEVQKKLYQHNDSFKQLLFDIKLLQKNISPPYEVLSQFAKELTRSGTRYTGSTYTPAFIAHICAQFRAYLDQLPPDFLASLLALSSADQKHTLDSVLENLAEGECVEQAGEEIGTILANHHNASVLKQRPDITEEQFQNIQKKYRMPLPIHGSEKNTGLPPTFLKPLLENIIITSTSDYLDLFLNLPSAEYLPLLTHAQIICYPPLPKMLSNALEMLSEEQRTAFYKTLLPLQKKFGGLSEVLEFCLSNNIVSVFQEALASITPEKLAKLLHEKLKTGLSFFITLIESNNHALFQLFWHKLTHQQRLAVLNEPTNTGYSVLHHAIFKDPATLQTLWQYAPSISAKIIQQRDDKHKNFLHYLLHHTNAQVFKQIWQEIPLSEREIQLYEKDLEDKTPLHYATANTNLEIFTIVSESVSKEIRSALITMEDINKNNLLHYAAQNQHPERFLMLLNALSPHQQFFELQKENNKHYTPLHLVAQNLEKNFFITVWSNLTEEQKIFASRIKNTAGSTIWHCALSHASPIFKQVWQCLSLEQQLEILKEKDSLGNSILYTAIQFHHPETLTLLNQYIIQSKNLKILIEKNLSGSMLLHRIIKNKNRDAFNLILQSTKEYDFLLAEDEHGHNAIYVAIRINALEIFLSIIGHLPETEVKKILEITQHQHYMRKALEHRNYEIFLGLWSVVKEQDRLLMLMGDYDFERSLFQVATRTAPYEIWKNLWDILPLASRLQIINKSLLRLAFANHPTILRTIFEFVKEHKTQITISNEDKLELLNEATNRHDERIFLAIWHYLPTPLKLGLLQKNLLSIMIIRKRIDILHTLIEYTSKHNKHFLFQRDAQGHSPLYLSVAEGNTEIFQLIWSQFSEAEQKFFLSEKDSHEITLLQQAARSGRSAIFFTLWNTLSRAEKLDAIQYTTKKSNTLLHFALRKENHAIFFAIWHAVNTEDRFSLIMKPNIRAYSALDYMIIYGHLKPFHRIWKSFSANQRLVMMRHKTVDGSGILHKATKQTRGDFFSILWNSLNAEEKSAALREVYSEKTNSTDPNRKLNNKISLLHLAVQNCSHTTWQCIWHSYSPSDQLALLQENINSDNSFLLQASRSGNYKVLQDFLTILPQSDRTMALLMRNPEQQNVLETALDKSPEIFRLLWKFLPAEEYWQLSNLPNDKISLLALALRTLAYDIFEILWNTLAEDNAVQALAETTGENQLSILHLVIKQSNYSLLRKILLSLSEADRLTVLNYQDLEGNSVLEFSLSQNKLQATTIIVQSVSIENRLALLRKQNKKGDSVLLLAARDKSSQIWNLFLDNLSQEDRLLALDEQKQPTVSVTSVGLFSSTVNLGAQAANPAQDHMPSFANGP